MNAKETEQRFLSRVAEFLVSLPFDLKVLQEAVSDPDLEKDVREIAAGAILHTLSPQEGEGPLRFVDDALLVRATLRRIVEAGGDGATAFRTRFAEIYDTLDDDIALFSAQLGETWTWLVGKVAGFPRVIHKGKRPLQYLVDDESVAALYEAGLEFETNYNVTEDQVRNRLRRPEQIVEALNKRRAEDARKKL